jgi:hypothetical protein
MSTPSDVRRGEQLAMPEWGPYFKSINRLLRDGTLLEATISVAADEAGGTEAEGLPLASITHEDGDDQIAIGLGGRGPRFPAVLWHFVDQPRQVWVDPLDDLPRVISIQSESGARTRVEVHPE